MLNLTEDEKVAFVKSLDEVIRADLQIDDYELDYFEQLGQMLGYNSNHLIKARAMEPTESISILRSMTPNKRGALEHVLKEMMKVDGDVDPRELRVAATITTLMNFGS